MKNLYFIFYILYFIFILTSCTIEDRIARDYVNQPKTFPCLVLRPGYLFKTNLKEDSLNDVKINLQKQYLSSKLPADSLAEASTDSMLLAYSTFLKEIKDTVLLNTYFNCLTEELKAFGIKVLTDSTELDENTADTIAYIFNSSQTEIEEYFKPYRDEVDLDTSRYVQTFDLNALSLNVWIESTYLNRMKAISKWEKSTKVLFAEHSATDDIEGGFKVNHLTGRVSYSYKRDDINSDDIIRLATYSGKKNASYIYDYIMNHEIYRKLKSLNKPKTIYYHYNRFRNLLAPAYDDHFLVVH